MRALALWIKSIRNRLWMQNKNWICVVCGETGSGKSWRALRLAELIDDTFNTQKIFWKSKDLMKYASADSKKGDVVIWDEAGIDEGANKRNWYSEQNKVMNYLFQTNRMFNYGVILTLPSLKYLDSGLVDLIHTYFECFYLDEKRDAVRCKVKDLQHNPLKEKTYKKNYRFRYQGRTWVLDNVWINRPQDRGITDYFETQQAIFKKQKATDWYNQLVDIEEKKRIDPHKAKDITTAVKEIIANIGQYTKEYNKQTIVDTFKIQNEFNVGLGTARRIKAAVSSNVVLN